MQRFIYLLAVVLGTTLFVEGPQKAMATGWGSLSTLPVDREVLDLHKNDTVNVRVKIFPHERNFPPHRADEIKHRVRMESSKSCDIYEGDTDSSTGTGMFLTSTKKIVLDAYKIKVPLWISCTEPVKIERFGKVDSYTYEGDMYIKSVYNKETKKRELLVVNIVPMEEYLRGVVPSEVIPTWPEETLKSQAVAARTYAVYHISYVRKVIKRNPHFDVDDTVRYQAYTGLSNIHPRTDLAVADTKGQILTFDNGIIQAFYHADSGGMTASAKTHWNMKVPYCSEKKEPYANKYISSWNKGLFLRDLNEKLAKKNLVSLSNPVVKLTIPPKYITKSGRVKAMVLHKQDGSDSLLSITDLKRSVELSSSKFRIKEYRTGVDGYYGIIGKGDGHGIGLSQQGSRILAQHYNWNYQKILQHYYDNINLCTLYDVEYYESADAKMLSCFENKGDQFASSDKKPSKRFLF